MKSRLSMEVKELLEQKKGRRSRCQLETSTTLTTCSTHHSTTLKRSSSSSTLPRTDSEIAIIQDRYLTLELNYRQLLEEAKGKGELFRRQREELDWYRSAHQRSQKELERLRTLIGFVKKTECSTQTEQQFSESAKGEKISSSLAKERRSPVNHSKGTGTAKEWAAYCKGSIGLKRGKCGLGKSKFIASVGLS